jgi:hypothetical protein
MFTCALSPAYWNVERRKKVNPDFTHLYPSSHLMVFGVYFSGFSDDAGTIFVDVFYDLCFVKLNTV